MVLYPASLLTTSTFARWIDRDSHVGDMSLKSARILLTDNRYSDVSDRHLYEAARIAQAQEREALAQIRAADAERQRAEADERRRAQGQ